MTTVLTLLMLIFLFGIPIFLVRLLLDIIKKRPKKKNGFGILICCVFSLVLLMNFFEPVEPVSELKQEIKDIPLEQSKNQEISQTKESADNSKISKQEITEDDTLNSDNILMLQEYKVDYLKNALGEPLESGAKYALLSINKSDLKKITEEEFREFMDKRVADQLYNWITIICEDGTGILCSPSSIRSAAYGYVDFDGAITEGIGTIFREFEDDRYSYTDVSTVSPKTESEKTGIEESLPDTLAETKEKISNEMKALLPEDVVNNERFDLWINLYDTDIYQIFLKINLQTDDIEECKKTSIEYFESLSKLEYTVETYFFTFLNDGDTICDISKSNGDNDFYISIDNKEPVLMELKSVKDEIKNDDSTSIPTEQSADLNEPESTSPTKDQSNSKQAEEAAPSTANQSNYEQVERVAIEEENKIESVQYVWVTATGSKYHSQPNCGRTKHASEITLEQAKARGLEACQKCAGWL